MAPKYFNKFQNYSQETEHNGNKATKTTAKQPQGCNTMPCARPYIAWSMFTL